ncbi:MAG: VCBS repeat-containing protein [Rhodospirillales bacterium]|nr:VCBS repeat-containing protein [Rhodospirillales bacterium]MDH3913012.1 VCBS repeat-containing protein [Rhodospirillales bacterium]MDH3919178.1 VCBS repeat-containing protein [Rhodospirillales bacterium]MDH3966764.1 VCBS repeat-containing protein [Rhodospirillales bacterium]
MDRWISWFVLWTLLLWPGLAGAGALDHLGIEVQTTRARPPLPLRPFDHPWPPADLLPDSRPGLGTLDVAEAWLVEPTTRYGHGVLGDAVEAAGLLVVLRDGRRLSYRLQDDSVFEDLQPRVADLDRDGREEVVVVRSRPRAGAALAVFHVEGGSLRPRAETPAIGRSNRWLNPVGVGDFDGDGRPEVAYVETPHIGGILRIWRLMGDHLVQLGELRGFSNHAIGSRELGLSAILDLDGDGSDDLLLPDATRRSLRVVSFAGRRFAELGRLEHDRPIVTGFTVGDQDGNGRDDVAYGLADGAWILLLR